MFTKSFTGMSLAREYFASALTMIPMTTMDVSLSRSRIFSIAMETPKVTSNSSVCMTVEFNAPFFADILFTVNSVIFDDVLHDITRTEGWEYTNLFVRVEA